MDKKTMIMLNEIHAEEQKKKNSTRDRNGFHLMPPVGWLNDPNGLCQMEDVYHLFFQYAPFDAEGGSAKGWGHYTTKNFVEYVYQGAALVPDMPYDRDGVYSGSAFVDEDGMHIFYTGNVKLPGNHDYIFSGRLADTVLVESEDGIHFSAKEVVIPTGDYPGGYSCHIRDPKVWKKGRTYYMLLGARTADGNGAALLYSSVDCRCWTLQQQFHATKHFGYMWECPDYFILNGQAVLSFSPQGLERQADRFQNQYQSGYVMLQTYMEEHASQITMDAFQEWDMGFDFYAPQTFMDQRGRRILVGWAGMPDAEYSNRETQEGWQHCLTMARRLSVKEDPETGKKYIAQIPLQEYETLRTKEHSLQTDREYFFEKERLELIGLNLSGEFCITIAKGVTFSFENGILHLKLDAQTGLGRCSRSCPCGTVTSLRIYIDTSILEIYVNEGQYVFTTRYYKEDPGVPVRIQSKNGTWAVYEMNAFVIREASEQEYNG